MSNNGIDYIIGKNGGEAPIVWTPNTCHNPHLIIGGSSGAGKTFTIRQIINAFVARGISFTILDKHGDIDGLEGIGEFNFGYGLGRGINPLSIVPDSDYGGPEANTVAFIGLLNELSGMHRLGPEQQNMLHNAIINLYRANGIKQEEVETWGQSTYPDLKDLQRFLMHKYKKLLVGGKDDSKEMDYLYDLYKKKRLLERLEKEALKGADVEDKILATISALVEKYEDYLKKGILNDKDFLIYTNPRGLLAVKNRIQNINNSGVFVKNEISLKNARIIIKNLEDEQKKIVTFYILKRLLDVFLKARYSEHVRHYLVIDEASFFLDISKISNLITRIVQEGRKFGLGIILATQNPLNFNNDILLNTATKMIFSVEPVIHRSVSKTFGVDPAMLKSVLPRKHCMYSTKAVNNGAYSLIKRTWQA